MSPLPSQPKPLPRVPAAGALPAGFVAPPRTITDITAILDSEKPDLKTIEKLKAAADAKPTGQESREDLAQFYFDRGNARVQLGRLADSIADANKAIEVGRGAVSANMMGRLIQLLPSSTPRPAIPRRRSNCISASFARFRPRRAKGYQFGANRQIAAILIQMGDIAQAEAYLRRNLPLLQEARTSGHPGCGRPTIPTARTGKRKSNIGRAMIFEARGQFRDAEASYKLGEQRKRAAIKSMLAAPKIRPPSSAC